MAIKFLDSTGLTYFINKIVYGITSPKFSTGSTYTVGDFVIYTGNLYRCTTAVTVAGAWSASKWVQTTVKGEIKALNTNLGGTTFSVTADGAYVHYTPTGGADPVVKKLGSISGLQTAAWSTTPPKDAIAIMLYVNSAGVGASDSYYSVPSPAFCSKGESKSLAITSNITHKTNSEVATWNATTNVASLTYTGDGLNTAGINAVWLSPST